MADDRRSSRLLELDVLRVMSIAFIVIHHTNDYASDVLRRLGPLAVADSVATCVALGLFVFLSGFLLSTRYPDLATMRDVTHFLIKRVLRIYPLYLLALASFIISSIVWLDIRGIIIHSLCLNLLIPAAIGGKILTLWFISLIIIYYVIYSILAYSNASLTRTIIGSACIATLAFVHVFVGWVDERLIIYLPMFLLGSHIGNKREQGLQSNNLLLLSIIGLALLSVPAYHYACTMRDHGFLTTFIFQNVIMLSSVVPAWRLSKRIARSINKIREVVVTVSYSTFCIYLFHRPVFTVMLALYAPKNDIMRMVWLVVVGIPVTFAVSLVIQAGYDRMLKKWFLPRALYFTAH